MFAFANPRLNFDLFGASLPATKPQPVALNLICSDNAGDGRFFPRPVSLLERDRPNGSPGSVTSYDRKPETS